MNDTSQSTPEHHHDGSFWLGLYLGGIIGAFLIHFLGTDDGKKLAKDLHSDGKAWIDKLEGKLEDLDEKGLELLKTGKELKKELLDQKELKKGEVTTTTLKKVDNALAHIEEIQERGRKTTSSIRKRVFKNIPKK